MSAAVLFTCAGQRGDMVSAFARAGTTTIAVMRTPWPRRSTTPTTACSCRGSTTPATDALPWLVAEHDVEVIVPLAAAECPAGRARALVGRVRLPAPIRDVAKRPETRTALKGIVCFAALKDRTCALDARTGRRLRSYSVGEYTPVVVDQGSIHLLGHPRPYGMVEG